MKFLVSVLWLQFFSAKYIAATQPLIPPPMIATVFILFCIFRSYPSWKAYPPGERSSNPCFGICGISKFYHCGQLFRYPPPVKWGKFVEITILFNGLNLCPLDFEVDLKKKVK